MGLGGVVGEEEAAGAVVGAGVGVDGGEVVGGDGGVVGGALAEGGSDGGGIVVVFVEDVYEGVPVTLWHVGGIKGRVMMMWFGRGE